LRFRHVAAQYFESARLQAPGAGDQAEHGGFADTIGTDQPDDAACRDRECHVIQGERLAVAERDGVQARGRMAFAHHFTGAA
jgi:hypothetical protein